jgi:hypothetical protein
MKMKNFGMIYWKVLKNLVVVITLLEMKREEYIFHPVTLANVVTRF